MEYKVVIATSGHCKNSCSPLPPFSGCRGEAFAESIQTMDLAGYYSARAGEYDENYARPERQEDLAQLRDLVCRHLAGLDVLEIPCGTGYWTECLAPTASSILAMDINESVLEIARGRAIPTDKVRFLVADACNIPCPEGSFTGALLVFWWSHVAREGLASFLNGYFACLRPGATVVIIDNNFVPGNSTRVSRTDAQGNTYQTRSLRDGTSAEVLKNFPTGKEIEGWLKSFAATLDIKQFTHYWCAVLTASRR